MIQKEPSNFLLPLDLLRDYKEKPVGVDFEESKKIIEKEFESAGVGVIYTSFDVAPRVSVFKYIIFENYENYKQKDFTNNLSLALKSYPVRVSLFSGLEKYIVIEIPNKKKALVGLKDALEDCVFDELTGKVGLPIGRDDNMSNDVVDIRQRGNIIIGGATNSGKSNFFHTVIASLLFQCKPEELGLILIDPKRVELYTYKGLQHLKFPVMVNAEEARKAFDWCMEEIDRRFDILQAKGISNIANYNLFAEEKWPCYIIMIDEFSDLMVADHDYFLKQITRIASMGGAVGFNIILGTSRPDPKQIMPKEMVAEFLVQISFSTASEQDSITILGESGGEKLLGQGDMLCKQSEIDIKLPKGKKIVAGDKVKIEKIENTPWRFQGFFISENEIEKIIEAVKAGNYIDRKELSEVNKDLFDKAEVLAKKNRELRAADLNDKLSIDHVTACRLIDYLLNMGIIDYTHSCKAKKLPDNITDEEKLAIVKKILYEERCYSPSAVQRRINITYSEAEKLVNIIQKQDGVTGFNIED
ncbi:hypothetical protein C0583_04610 [Candidatus Parcubacteria bacterium]|nr:MAG: hypothetical protein C0583_04610 [Candidatus Parcubacteria bacterium]